MMRFRDSTVDEQILFKKQGTGTLQRKSSLLHSDDVFILIESCQSFPNYISHMNTTIRNIERKKRSSKLTPKAKKSGKCRTIIPEFLYMNYRTKADLTFQ